MKRFFGLFLTLVLLFSAIGSPVQAAFSAPAAGEAQTLPVEAKAPAWCVAGSFQGWNNSSHPMYDDATHGDRIPSDGVYSLSQSILTAGDYQFKVVTCGDWSTAYPANNSWFSTSTAGQNVLITFDTNNHAADAGPAFLPAQNIVNVNGDTLPTSYTVVGDFQGWINNYSETQMTYLGHGLYRLSYVIPSANTYNGRMVKTGDWNGFGPSGRSTGDPNFSFTTTAPNTEMIFLLDVYTGRSLVQPAAAGSGTWCAAGGFNDWSADGAPLYDDGTHGDVLGNDGVFSLDMPIPTAGRYEFKITACSWSTSYPASGNSWFYTTTHDKTVKFTFDTNNHSTDSGIAYLPAVNIINVWDDTASFTAVGSFNGWNNADAATLMTAYGNDSYQYNYTAAASQTYSGKVVNTGVWDGFGGDGRSVNAGNVDFSALSGQVFYTLLDARAGRIAFVPGPNPGASHDNNIWYASLGHDSRDALYRTPGGPVTTGTPVTLRLRAAAGDLTAARVRLYNDRTNAQSFLNMTLAAADDTYEWWQATIPASADPTVYWYRFIAIDGTATAYYEDDAARDGGWGEAFASSPDNSYQLTVYDPAYTTPDWIKNAIVYQVFPDRFRDGDASNDTPAGSFFYNEPGGTVYRSVGTDWNTPVCDPRAAATPCSGTYSKNFYGGDLQGLIDKLDYLQGLGVTAIYLNPIFLSPSNHGYDTSNYLAINPSLGDQALFTNLATEAHARGIHLILDGVFNHVSSDSIYFDRYSRYSEVGACESPSSPYRAWFTFTDVPAGTGACAGSDGTPKAANYSSWWGYDSLPILNSHNPEVRNLVYANGLASVAPFWLQWADGWRLDVGGDLDPGVTGDPANTYWEEFRAAVHAVRPDAYIAGEEWGNASSWLLGNEWDGVMNYQFSTAALGFWRTTTFTDNDHASGSSAGLIVPLTPSGFDNRIRNLAERYPPEALQAMLNLFDSHDTSRVLFMLDENASLNDPSLYANPAYDWSDAISRLKAAVILQMTLPGAPTIYYGDEVGLVGPMAYSGGKWEDDPYNRQPYPWLDESGTPFYTHLQSAAAQQNLYDYYANLGEARNDHPALRTGDFKTLLVDDTAGLYAYGRRITGTTPDAAVVVLNQHTAAQPVTLDVSGYLAIGTSLMDVLTETVFTVNGSGQIVIDNVPGRSGVVLVLQTCALTPPDRVTDLAVSAEGNSTIDLSWTAAAGAEAYRVYRSELMGGGYQYIGQTAATTYHDSGLVNARRYYYVIVAVNNTSGLQSDYSNEASGIPHPAIGWANLQWPYTITHTIGITPTVNIYGQIWIDGVTNFGGRGEGVLAQVGFGTPGSDPALGSWIWWDATFNGDVGSNDEYVGTLLPEQTGTFDYAYRYSTDGGVSWVYADLTGTSDGYSSTDAGKMTVVASSDTEVPSTPVLSILDWGADFISLSWTAATDNAGVHAYDIYRSVGADPALKIGRVDSATLTYTDTTVVTGTTYTYYVVALDTSFNPSLPSNSVSHAAEAKIVQVTINVTVPAFTPADDTIYFTRVVNPDGTLGNWDPAATPLTPSGTPNVWTGVINLLDGTQAEFKFTRGSWDTVIKAADGNTEVPNLTFTAAYGTTGLQTYEYSVLNWRDPLVVSFEPADGTIAFDPANPAHVARVTFSQAMPASAELSLFIGGTPVPAVTTLEGTDTLAVVPADGWQYGQQYTVEIYALHDAAGDLQQRGQAYSFTTLYRSLLPIIYR